MTRKNRAAVALGRRGGKAGTEAQNEARRRNGAHGGRPVKLVTVGAGPGVQVQVHADAAHVGYTVDGQPAFLPRTPAAARWLSRHGYEFAEWELREIREELPRGRCWA